MRGGSDWGLFKCQEGENFSIYAEVLLHGTFTVIFSVIQSSYPFIGRLSEKEEEDDCCLEPGKCNRDDDVEFLSSVSKNVCQSNANNHYASSCRIPESTDLFILTQSILPLCAPYGRLPGGPFLLFPSIAKKFR